MGAFLRGRGERLLERGFYFEEMWYAETFP